MKAQELRSKSVDDLGEELIKLRRQQFNLRMQKATDETARTHEMGQTRRDIARIKTVINEKRAATAVE